MINAAASVVGAAVSGTAAAVGTVAGKVANAFKKDKAGSGSAAVGNNITQNLLQHAKAQSEMINAVTSKPHTDKGHGPRGGVLPTGMAGLADVAMHQGDKGVDQAGHAMKGVLGQMSQVMAMNMEVQTQMSIGQMIKNAYEGVTKEIKNLGNIKNSAGG